MNRRTFNATSLAALLAPFPPMSSARSAVPDLPGYQIAEINAGRLSTKFGGMARQDTEVKDNTLFQVASCSKTVTALTVLTLVRDGRVDLHQPVNTYLKRWKLSGPRAAETTVMSLMSHSAGTTVHGFEGYGPDDTLPDLGDILTGHYPANSEAVRTRRRLFRGFKYSGGGTMILQALIEDVSGTPFATFARMQVLLPVGAPRATFAVRPTTAFAFGSHKGGQWLEGGFRRHPESAAAGLWATASDLAKVLQAILHALDGARGAIIPMGLAEKMVTPVCAQSGLGVFVTPGPVISHDGRNIGFDAVMSAELTTGRIRAAVTNRNGALAQYADSLELE